LTFIPCTSDFDVFTTLAAFACYNNDYIYIECWMLCHYIYIECWMSYQFHQYFNYSQTCIKRSFLEQIKSGLL